MAAHSRATCAVLLLAALARAAAGGPSCGPEEVCGPQDVEAVEEASVDALRVELLQSRGRIVSPASSSPRQESHGAETDLVESGRTEHHMHAENCSDPNGSPDFKRGLDCPCIMDSECASGHCAFTATCGKPYYLLATSNGTALGQESHGAETDLVESGRTEHHMHEPCDAPAGGTEAPGCEAPDGSRPDCCPCLRDSECASGSCEFSLTGAPPALLGRCTGAALWQGSHGAGSDLVESERTKYYMDVWELGRRHVEQQIALARTHSASPNATAPSLPAFPEIGDRVAELAKASNVTVRNGIRIEDGDWPEDGESCPYPTGAPISCIKGWHCCNSRQIKGALPAQLYSVCCQNTGIASKCGTWIFFVGCIG